MKKYTLLFFLSVIPLLLFSQSRSERVTQLKSEWKTKSPEEIYADKHIYQRSGDSIALDFAAGYLLEKAKETQKLDYYIMGHHLKADYFRIKGATHEAIASLNKAIIYVEKNKGFYNERQLYLSRANFNYSLGNYQQALDDHLILFNSADKARHPELIRLKANYSIAKIKSLTYNPKEALPIYMENIEVLEKSSDLAVQRNYNNTLINNWLGMTRSYIDLKEYEKAISLCHQIITKSEEIDSEYNKGLGFIGLTEIYSLTGDFKKSLEYIKQFEALDDYLGKDFFYLAVYLAEARRSYSLGTYNEVIINLQKLEALKNKYQFDFFLFQEIYVLYARTYEQIGEIDLSLDYYEQSQNVYKNNAERQSTISRNINERYQLAGFKEELQQIKRKSSAQKQWLHIGLTSLLIILIASTGYFYTLQKRNKQRFDQLLTELNNEKSQAIPQNMPSSYQIEDDKKQEILIKLTNFEQNEGYLDNTLTLAKLSKTFNTNTSYLSQVINQQKNQSFIGYLTALRLEYIMRRLKDDKNFRKLTIDTMVKEAGFNSVNPFNKAFKLKTGLNPSYFIKALNKTVIT